MCCFLLKVPVDMPAAGTDSFLFGWKVSLLVVLTSIVPLPTVSVSVYFLMSALSPFTSLNCVFCDDTPWKSPISFRLSCGFFILALSPLPGLKSSLDLGLP